MRIASYMIYLVFYETLTIGGTAWVVFIQGQSGWWWILGVIFSAGCIKPERWTTLWDEKLAEKYRHKDYSE